jgi:hypothetical protein
MLDHPIYRHAAYFAPAQGHPLAERGAQWLGRCALTRRALPTPPHTGIPDTVFRQYTAAAARYGWHATMKAPFILQTGLGVPAIAQAFAAFARSQLAVALPPLELRNMGDYLALVPSGPSQALQDLAFACVGALHPLAEPLTAQQVAQRRSTPLSPQQDAMLLQWGYPFVGDQFQWHMTLTGSLQGLTPQAVQQLHTAASEWFGPLLNRPLMLDAISWFIEPHAGGDFYEAQRFPLGGA